MSEVRTRSVDDFQRELRKKINLKNFDKRTSVITNSALTSKQGLPPILEDSANKKEPRTNPDKHEVLQFTWKEKDPDWAKKLVSV